MIDLQTVTPADMGREIRYTSTSKHTIQLGKLSGIEGEYALVEFHTQVKPKTSNKSMAGDPVSCDPANLEFA